MNAIREPSEPIGQNLRIEHAVKNCCAWPIYSLVVIIQFNSERFIAIQNQIYVAV